MLNSAEGQKGFWNLVSFPPPTFLCTKAENGLEEIQQFHPQKHGTENGLMMRISEEAESERCFKMCGEDRHRMR